MTLVIPQCPQIEPAVEYAVKQLRKEFDDTESATEAIILFQSNPWFRQIMPEEFNSWIQDLKGSTDRDTHWLIDRFLESLNEPADYSPDYSEVPGLEFMVSHHELITLPEKI